MSRRTYRCVIEWNHRKWGPQMQKSVAEGTSIRRAINNALLAFFSDTSQREHRRDAHAHIEIKAWRVKKEAAK
jgi:hypothetical protein